MSFSLSDLASIAEIAGAVVVTVSLLIVAVQIRNNTRATQAATLQDSVGHDIQILAAVGGNTEASLALYDYSFRQGDLPEESLIQGRWLFASTVRHWENLYLQHLSGTLSADAWQAREPALKALVTCPGWDEYVNSVFGAFMGGPFMEYARETRAAAGMD